MKIGGRPLCSGKTDRTGPRRGRYFQKFFINLDPCLLPYLEKHEDHEVKCLLLVAGSIFLLRRVLGRTHRFAKLTYVLLTPDHLFRAALRAPRGCLSGDEPQLVSGPIFRFFLSLIVGQGLFCCRHLQGAQCGNKVRISTKRKKTQEGAKQKSQSWRMNEMNEDNQN